MAIAVVIGGTIAVSVPAALLADSYLESGQDIEDDPAALTIVLAASLALELLLLATAVWFGPRKYKLPLSSLGLRKPERGGWLFPFGLWISALAIVYTYFGILSLLGSSPTRTCRKGGVRECGAYNCPDHSVDGPCTIHGRGVLQGVHLRWLAGPLGVGAGGGRQRWVVRTSARWEPRTTPGGRANRWGRNALRVGLQVVGFADRANHRAFSFQHRHHRRHRGNVVLTMGRIDETFARLKAEGRTGFVAFVTVGYPDVEATLDIVPALAEGGADIIELGVPFSDPLADGRRSRRRHFTRCNRA